MMLMTTRTVFFALIVELQRYSTNVSGKNKNRKIRLEKTKLSHSHSSSHSVIKLHIAYQISAENSISFPLIFREKKFQGTDLWKPTIAAHQFCIFPILFL